MNERDFIVFWLFGTLGTFRCGIGVRFPALRKVFFAEIILALCHCLIAICILMPVPFRKCIPVCFCKRIDGFFYENVAIKSLPHQFLLHLIIHLLQLIHHSLCFLTTGFDLWMCIGINQTGSMASYSSVDVLGEYAEKGAVLLTFIFTLL